MSEPTEECASDVARRQARREWATKVASSDAGQDGDITTTPRLFATVLGHAIAILICAVVTA